MFGWLSKAMEGQAAYGAAKEVERFIDGLKRTPDRDLGVIVGIAAVVRVNMETHGILPEGLFARDDLPPGRELGLLQWRINGVARDFTKARQAADATGAMIWSYSLRCLNSPELRRLGNMPCGPSWRADSPMPRRPSTRARSGWTTNSIPGSGPSGR